MKRVLTGILILILVLALCMATAYAVGPRRGRNYVDTDRDGVCDLAGSQCNWQDANGDGICDNCGRNPVGCLGYADQDGDGIATIVEWPKAAANRPAVQAMLTWTGTAYVTTG